MWGWDHHWYGGPWMMFLWIILIIVIAWGGWALFDRSRKGPEQRRPLDILNERYAAGEISKEEYEERKKDLTA